MDGTEHPIICNALSFIIQVIEEFEPVVVEDFLFGSECLEFASKSDLNPSNCSYIRPDPLRESLKGQLLFYIIIISPKDGHQYLNASFMHQLLARISLKCQFPSQFLQIFKVRSRRYACLSRHPPCV